MEIGGAGKLSASAQKLMMMAGAQEQSKVPQQY